MGFEQITAISSAKSTTVPKGARWAKISASGQPVRWRDDGTAPTGTVGMYIAVNETIDYAGNLNALQFIETTTSAAVNISYYS